MIDMTGYTVSEELYVGLFSIVYRGIRDDDSQPVIVKVLNQEHPSEELLSSFEREFEIARELSGEGTVPVFDLVSVKNSLAIVMEDIEALSGRGFE